MSSLPNRVNAMQVFTYDTHRVMEIIHEETGCPLESITLDDILARVEEWAQADMGCDWGHTKNPLDLVFTDEDGNEL